LSSVALFIYRKHIIFQAFLGKAMFTSTRKLFEENQIWTTNEINKRAEEISEWACKSWEYPKV